MSQSNSDMSFSSSASEDYHTSDSELSEEELIEFDKSKKKIQNPEHRDEIIKDVNEAKNNKYNPLDNISTDPSYPYVFSSKSYIRTLALFNHTTDLAHWVNKQNSINDFDHWLSVPRSSRVPYTPLNMYGGYWCTKKIDFNYKSLLVKNLSVKTTGFQLREIFSRYGFIRDVYIPTNHSTGEKCNYAFIEIHPIVEVDRILKDMAQFSILNGKSMQVQLAVSGRRSATEMKDRYTTDRVISTLKIKTCERFQNL